MLLPVSQKRSDNTHTDWTFLYHTGSSIITGDGEETEKPGQQAMMHSNCGRKIHLRSEYSLTVFSLKEGGLPKAGNKSAGIAWRAAHSQ